MANLAARLLRAAATNPGDTAFLTSEGSTTYGELSDRVSRIRGGLSSAGVGHRDRVAILTGGSAFVETYVAVLGLGAVAVPLNLLSPGAELARGLVSTETGIAVADGSAAEAARGVGAEIFDPAQLVESDPGPETFDVDDDDPAAMLMTSGTTGEARAAVLTHGSLRANLNQLDANPGMRAEPNDVGFAMLPFFHVFGLNVVAGYSLYTGTTLAFPYAHGGAAWLEAIERFNVSVVLGTPQVFAGWLSLEPPQESLSSVRVAVSGAAPLDIETYEGFSEHFGKPLWEGYGLTEASPVVSTTRMDPEPTPGSVGRPLPGVEVELRSGDGSIALLGDPGEVWVRGPNLFAGYWNDEVATSETLIDGWLKTGDVAVADEDGRLYLVDRSRDIVIVSGFNVFPAEIEEVLLAHSEIREAAVVGRPSSRTGEEVVAYVVAKGATRDAEAVREFCMGRISRYKVPVEINFVDQLPHTFIGKIRRGELRSD